MYRIVSITHVEPNISNYSCKHNVNNNKDSDDDETTRFLRSSTVHFCY